VHSHSHAVAEQRASSVRQLTEERIRAWQADARTWAIEALPRLNMGILEGRLDVDAFVAEATPVLEALREVGIDSLAACRRADARRYLETLGFVACSVERHMQALGRPQGAGLGLLPGLEDALALAGMAAELPPTLGYTGYWLDNSGERPLTFTGDPQERFFRDMVVKVNDLHSRACALLRPIACGDVRVVDGDAVDRLLAAAEAEDGVHDCYRSFRPVGPAAREEFTVPFFTFVMRTFLVAFPVHGRTFHGPNAANIAAQASLDYVSGLVEPFYRQHVEERMHYMSLEERMQVVQDMRMASVLDRLLDALGLTSADVLAWPPYALASRIEERVETMRPLTAFGEFKRAAGGAAGAHYGLIVQFLQRATPEEGPRTPA
jgi:hypothetical protein